ncbi:NAD(P)-binding domain [Cinara cedri]|uniref:NAD(P)-binding domain n=1 Tax=Cinara cedri TaxID=506608 RepID=A0A5E4NG11_9HEMI|nr:NAD(P)-binding domain [Cinara cedri]
MYFNDVSCSDELTTANLFSDLFSSFYSTKKNDVAIDQLGILTFDLPNNIYFSVDDIYYRLSYLQGVGSAGPDGLFGIFLYELREMLANPLLVLFRCSLDNGSFPSMFKLSSITPVFKSGCHSLILNYRLITIKSHVVKIFEALILNIIQGPTNNILIEEQHGFCLGHSASTCNLLFSSYIFNTFQKQSHKHVYEHVGGDTDGLKAVREIEIVNICGKDFITIGGTRVIDYLHIMDLAECHIINMFSQVSKKKKKIKYELVDRPPGYYDSSYCDVSFAKEYLGWEAKRTLKEMCEDTLRWQSLYPREFSTET